MAKLSRAFTLVELLVTLSLVAVLLAILLPAMSRARDAAHDVSCSGWLQQMNAGWYAVLMDTDYRIPETHSGSAPPGNPLADPTSQRWDLLLNQTLRTDHRPGHDLGVACPTARNTYNALQNTYGFTTYGVNVRWTPGSAPGDNERRSWDLIARPTQYPFFADTDALQLGSTQYIRDEFGRRDGLQPSPTWQLGTIHASQTVNLAWADGHVAPETADFVDGPTDDMGVPLVFFNYRLTSPAFAVAFAP